MKSLTELTKECIDSLREEEKSVYGAPQTEGIIVDFNHLETVVNQELLEYPSELNRMLRSNVGLLGPWSFLVKLTTSYNIRLYKKFADRTLTRDDTKLTDSEQELFLVQLWRQNVNSITATFSLLACHLTYQANQALRSYIESSRILYLALTDSTFLEQYLEHGTTDDDYLTQWFKHLKPAKVEAKIRRQVADMRSMSIGGYSDFIADQINTTIVGDFAKNIYTHSSDYIHFRKKALFFDSYNDVKQGYALDLSATNPAGLKRTALNILELISHTSSILEVAAQHPLKPRTIDWDLSRIHIFLVTAAPYNGLYDFVSKAES
jgi:hypothetical protein